MYPVAVRLAVKLSGNPQVGGLFTVGGADPAVVGLNMPTAGIIPAILINADDAGVTGQYLYDGFHFDIAQTARIREKGPALVSIEQLFERAGTETSNHRAD